MTNARKWEVVAPESWAAYTRGYSSVALNGQIIDTYMSKELAQAYVNYMISREGNK